MVSSKQGAAGIIVAEEGEEAESLLRQATPYINCHGKYNCKGISKGGRFLTGAALIVGASGIEIIM